MRYTTIIKRFRTEQAKLAVRRDKMRELLGELEDQQNDIDEAYDDLEHAIEALSRLV